MSEGKELEAGEPEVRAYVTPAVLTGRAYRYFAAADAHLSADKLLHQPPRAAPKLSPVRNGLPRLVTCLHQVEYLPHPCCVRMRKRAPRARLNGEDVDVHAL